MAFTFTRGTRTIDLDLHVSSWDESRIIADLERRDYVVVTEGGYWRASFQTRFDALEFANTGDALICPNGSIFRLERQGARYV